MYANQLHRGFIILLTFWRHLEVLLQMKATYHSQWKSLNIQSIFSQISVYVLALRSRGEMSSRFHIALYMWCVLWGSHLHPPYEERFYLFLFTPNHGKDLSFCLYLINCSFINETETTAIQLEKMQNDRSFTLFCLFIKYKRLPNLEV